ncbi:MAG: 4Fe-4S binding protein [Bacteroidota bacterium]
MSQYFENINTSFKTLAKGLKITWGYLKQAHKSRKPYGIAEDEYFSQNEGLFTLQYPHEMIPVPDNGRYRLHNEIDDCIVCDKCAKICPVDCIDIEPIRAVDTIGLTSDGTPKRIHAAKFDIDMSKCCFCGLCTTVCPTECLTMTKTFDFSEEDVRDHNYAFAEMSLVDIAAKRKEFEDFQKSKEKSAEVMEDKGESSQEAKAAPAVPKPKPKIAAKPTFKPKFKPRPMMPKKPKDDK